MADPATQLIGDILLGTFRPLDTPAATQAAAEAMATMDVIDSLILQRRFEQSNPELLSHPKKADRSIRRRHVMAALPLSAALLLGRVGNPDLQRALRTCERVDGTNSASLEVTR